MLKLRLEVQPGAPIHEVCTQAARIATFIGVQVIFGFNGKEVIAKPGMDAGSLIAECESGSSEPSVVIPAATPATPLTEPKAPGKKGKQKEGVAEAAKENVQEESI